MRLCVAALGSAGDVHPFLAVAAAMRARGHDVALLSVPSVAPTAAALGVPFTAVCSDDDLRRTAEHPRLWDPRGGLGVLWRHLGVPALQPTYEAVATRAAAAAAAGERLVVLASPLAMGARVAREVHDLRLVTGFTSPANLRSVRDPLFVADLRVPPAVPRWARHLLWAALDRVKLDPMLRPGLERLRSQLGLAPLPPSILARWLPSPDASLALWPAWFADADPSWPRGLEPTGFAFLDLPAWLDRPVAGAPAPPAASDWASFVAQGTPPVVFMPGSAAHDARDFFTAALAATAALGVRALLLSPRAGQWPTPLPAGVVGTGLVPFASLLPRVRALVHHGGIGTCAQALRAGVPQLVVAQAFDQFDNGERLVRLGAGRWLRAGALSGEALRRELAALLAMDTAACRQIAARCHDDDAGGGGVRRACDRLERIAGERP